MIDFSELKKRGKKANRSQKNTFIIFIILLVFCSISGCISSSKDIVADSNGTDEISVSEHTVTIVDSLNHSVTFPDHPKRIVAANQQALDLLIAIGAGEQVVGVPEFVVQNKEYMKNLPNAQAIGGVLGNINCEQIISLKPDVVIAYVQYKPKAINRLIEANISVIYFNGFGLSESHENIQQLGLLTGNERNATDLNTFIDYYSLLIKSRISNRTDPQPRVYFEYCTDYTTYGKGSMGDVVLHIVNATNLAGTIDQGNPVISPEWVIQQNPDIIVKRVCKTGLQSNLTTLPGTYSGIIDRPGLSNVSAVRNKRVYLISSDATDSTRQILGTVYLAKMIYPVEFSDIDPEEVRHEYMARFLKYSDQLPSFYPTGSQ